MLPLTWRTLAESLVRVAVDHDLVLDCVMADEAVVGDATALMAAVDDRGGLRDPAGGVLAGCLGGVEALAKHRPEVVPGEAAALEPEGEAVPISVDADAVETSPGEQRHVLETAILDGIADRGDLTADPVSDILEQHERTAELVANSAVLEREVAVLNVQQVGERPDSAVDGAL